MTGMAAVVGRAESCPDPVGVAWIRLVAPEESDSRRSRWPTDPVWRVVQSATFADAPAEARRLIRRKQRGQDVSLPSNQQQGFDSGAGDKRRPESASCGT